MSWIDCKFGEGYEIFTEFPFYIRKKSNKRIVKESVHKRDGYVYLCLNRVQYYKHRIVASQFIPNDEPLIKTDVDHINHDRSDYHLSNLRWVSPSQNQLNKSSFKGVEYEFIDYEETPDDLIIVDKYGVHEFEDYYYSPENNLFYFDSGVNLRILHVNFKKNGSAFVNMMNKENEKVQIRFTKFKKIYGFD